MFAEVDQPGVGVHLVPGSPLAFGELDATERGAAVAPRLGEHTEEVLANELGLGSTEIGALITRGAVALAD